MEANFAISIAQCGDNRRSGIHKRSAGKIPRGLQQERLSSDFHLHLVDCVSVLMGANFNSIVAKK